MSGKERLHSATAPPNSYPAWSPRFWHGMRAGCWWRLLIKNRFRVSPRKLHIALGVSVFTPFNDLLAIAQALFFERQIQRTEVTRPPVFILGHWRSGTTLLHELMVTDPQFASPSTYQCFAPSHFLLSEALMVRFGGFLLPKKRPMDDMEAGWRLPQEDEFALMNLGVPSPYLRIAFPKTQAQALEYLSMNGLSEAELASWRSKFTWFIRALTYHYGGKRLVIKSPPHTGRITELSRLYPDAKFIHLTRDPRKLFSSTLRLWKSLEQVQALHESPSDEEMKDYVTECLTRMYRDFDAAREDVGSRNVVDLRYEDLVANPMTSMSRLYEELELGDFGQIAPQLEKRLSNHDRYRPNEHRIDEQLEREILKRWPDYAARYGYEELQSSR